MLTLIIADAAKVSAKISSELPGRGTQAKKQSEAWATEAGAKIDSTVSIFSIPSIL
jgi:hypothetical protein